MRNLLALAIGAIAVGVIIKSSKADEVSANTTATIANTGQFRPSVGAVLDGGWRLKAIGNGSLFPYNGYLLPAGTVLTNLDDGGGEWYIDILGTMRPKAQSAPVNSKLVVASAQNGNPAFVDMSIPRYTAEQLAAAKAGGYYLL